MGLGEGRPWYHQLFPLVLPLVSRRFDGLVCNGRAVGDWAALRERVPLEKIRIIHNGAAVPAPPFTCPELFRNYPNTLWIGVVASLTPIKRIDVFLRALAQLAELRPELQFQGLVLGEGPEREPLLALSRELGLAGRVHFPGTVRNVSPFLFRLHIGVLCSDREGFSNSVLEYMAHELPVVVTAVGGNTELVEPTNGFCVPPGDADALAGALCRLADDQTLRAQLGRAGREKVRRDYSWERSMAEHEDYYVQMLAGKTTIGRGSGG